MIRDNIFTSQTADYQHSAKFHGCLFCEIKSSEILVRSENLFLIADPSPLTEGHVMLISDAHYGCAGEISSSLLPEYEAMVQTTKDILLRAYPENQSIAMYEHGRAGHCDITGEFSCHHFHLHFLPRKLDIHETLAQRFREIMVSDIKDIAELYQLYGDYLFFASTDQQFAFYPAQGEIESHLLRTLIANALKTPERSDWAKWCDPVAVVQAKTKIKSQITKTHFQGIKTYA